MSPARFALAGAAGVGLVLLAGCTSSSAPARRSPARVSHPATSPALTQPSAVPSSVPNRRGVISAGLVSLSSCAATTGGWRAAGTARGPVGRATRYTVTVFFTSPQATVQAFGSTTVDVAAGASRSWSITARFPAVPDTRCVLRGAG